MEDSETEGNEVTKLERELRASERISETSDSSALDFWLSLMVSMMRERIELEIESREWGDWK